MNITNAKYYKGTLDNGTYIQATIDGEETHIPLDTANRHYIAIQKWDADGNTIEEADYWQAI